MNMHGPNPISQRELPAQPPVVVDARLMGRVVVKGVLCRHGTGDAPDIARQLDNVGVAAFEGPLSDEYKRAHDETMYTRMVSRPLDLDSYRQLNTSRGNQLAAIIGCLIDGGPKAIRLIDVASGSKEWEEYQRSLQVLDSYQRGMNRFPGVGVARAARSRLTGSLAMSNQAREDYMYQRLERIVDEVGQKEEPPAVGVVLGLSHLPLIRRLGQPLDPEKSAQVEKRVAEIASPATLAVVAQRTNTDPSAHINRALLDDYAQRAFGSDHKTKAALQATVKTLPDADAESWLEAVDRSIADTGYEWSLQPNLATTMRELLRGSSQS